jgi:hypothetical protein
MKAKIIECRKLRLFERIKSCFIKEYVTVWELETGRIIPIYTVNVGGVWTHLYLEERLSMVYSSKLEAEKLAKNIGYEITLGE